MAAYVWEIHLIHIIEKKIKKRTVCCVSPQPAVEQRCGSTCWSAQQLIRHDCPLCWDQSLWTASVTVCQFLCGVKPAGGCSCPGWTSTNQIAISRSRTAASLCWFQQFLPARNLSRPCTLRTCITTGESESPKLIPVVWDASVKSTHIFYKTFRTTPESLY